MDATGKRGRRLAGAGRPEHGGRSPGARPGDQGLIHGLQGATSSCGLAQAQVIALLDGELSASDAAWVESHLGGCPSCCRERDALDAVRIAVSQSLDAVELPDTKLASVLARIDAGEIDPLARAEQDEFRRPRSGSLGGSTRSARRAPEARRPFMPWMLGAGATAAVAALFALVVLPTGRGLQGWLETPSHPAGVQAAPALTLTGRVAPTHGRVEGQGRRAETLRGRADGARDGSLASADPSADLQVPDELRRRPGLFLDMGVVRRLDKLKKMEAVYRSKDDEGRAG